MRRNKRICSRLTAFAKTVRPVRAEQIRLLTNKEKTMDNKIKKPRKRPDRRAGIYYTPKSALAVVMAPDVVLANPACSTGGWLGEVAKKLEAKK